MKMLMRPSKTQFPSVLKFTAPGNFAFKRDLYIMAGYQTYDVMCVGGAGGRAGKSQNGNSNVAFGCAGGGGGSIRGGGTLQSLADVVNGQVGAAGSDGADKGNNVVGGSGLGGGASFFNLFNAGGGNPGTGGKINTSNGTHDQGVGGDGGSNNGPYGVKGLGGGDTRGSSNSQATDGTWVTSGGCGGGGGPAQVKLDGVIRYNAYPGGDGSLGNVDVEHAGEAPINQHGGKAGGASIKPITGVSEFYGSFAVGANEQGVVAIKLS